MRTGIKGKCGVRLVRVMQLVITPVVLYVIWISHQNSHGLERWTQRGYRPGTEPARRPLAGGGQSGHFEHGCHPRVPASGRQVSKRHEGEMLGAVIFSKGFWWQTSCRELSSAAAQRAAGPGSRRAAHSCSVPRADKAAPAPALLLPAWHGWQCWMDHGPDTLCLSHHLETRKTELKGKKKKKDRAFTSHDPHWAAWGDEVSVCGNAPLWANRGEIAPKGGTNLCLPSGGGGRNTLLPKTQFQFSTCSITLLWQLQ